jgi:hypothetical protein
MKKTLLFVVVSVALFVLAISGCSKKNEDVSPTMKNVAGTYKMTALTGSFGGFTLNLYDSVPACQKDDNYKFNADSTYQYIDAGTQCDTSYDYSGTWVISGSYIILDQQGEQDSATIKSFNGSQLVITFTDNSTGFPISATQTFTKL